MVDKPLFSSFKQKKKEKKKKKSCKVASPGGAASCVAMPKEKCYLKTIFSPQETIPQLPRQVEK